MRIHRLASTVLIGLAALAFTLPAPAPSAGGAQCRDTTLVGVAHQDDDLLFINPAVAEDFDRGSCLRVVYVTAGDAHLEWAGGYVGRRERGVQQAYSALAGRPMRPGEPTPWQVSPVRAGGRTVHGVRLDNGPLRPDIRLLFLRLPDGGWREEASRRRSLLALFQSRVRSLRAVDGSARYTEAALIATLAALIELFRPGTVRTLDFANTALRSSGERWADHNDHAVTGRYLRLAALRARPQGRPPRLRGYEGYGTAVRPPNLDAARAARKAAVFAHYYIHDERRGNSCPGHYCAPTRKVAPQYERWLERSYARPVPDPRPGTVVSWIGSTATGFTTSDLCLTRDRGTVRSAPCNGTVRQRWRLTDGVLRAERTWSGDVGPRCVHVAGRGVVLASCARAPARWTITPRGQLRTGEGCLTQDDLLRPRPGLRLAACAAEDPGQRWFTRFR
ncbi:MULTISPECIES: ricin-type beta-trefoil lectin domain protein [unclassified Streptomyces]|uniref:ricin-type beta-trefoil lectin domain protein n=1 Tax=unclassified Streptomyces TaxID=2593676 RepID=UPI001CBF8280|nr:MULTISPECIES: ricin-type beta-trefoil lectin domain protein [unclassified Streptomyces]WPO74148.1 ricin-type beta-trefoil lectin domain protein [Streptomyces sp. KN37]